MADQQRVAEVVYQLGVPAYHQSYRYLCCAVILCSENPESLELVTKWLYPDIAKKVGKTWAAVEMGLRRGSKLAWTRNRPMLEQLLHRELPKPPPAAELVAALYYEITPEALYQSLPL